MNSEYTWPKPYLLDLYAKAVEEGCIRIVLRGETGEARDAEAASFKAAFYRLRRRKDSHFLVQMRPEYSLVQVKYEPELGKVLLSYSSLPDGDTLPMVESVDKQRPLPQPLGALPRETPEEDPDDFDPTAHVAGLIDKINLDDAEPSDEL